MTQISLYLVKMDLSSELFWVNGRPFRRKLTVHSELNKKYAKDQRLFKYIESLDWLNNSENEDKWIIDWNVNVYHLYEIVVDQLEEYTHEAHAANQEKWIHFSLSNKLEIWENMFKVIDRDLPETIRTKIGLNLTQVRGMFTFF